MLLLLPFLILFFTVVIVIINTRNKMRPCVWICLAVYNVFVRFSFLCDCLCTLLCMCVNTCGLCAGISLYTSLCEVFFSFPLIQWLFEFVYISILIMNHMKSKNFGCDQFYVTNTFFKKKIFEAFTPNSAIALGHKVSTILRRKKQRKRKRKKK